MGLGQYMLRLRYVVVRLHVALLPVSCESPLSETYEVS